MAAHQGVRRTLILKSVKAALFDKLLTYSLTLTETYSKGISKIFILLVLPPQNRFLHYIMVVIVSYIVNNTLRANV